MDSYMFRLYYLYSLLFVFVCDGKEKYKVNMVASDVDSSKAAMYTHIDNPVWDPFQQCLYFVDIHDQSIHKLDYASGKFDKRVIAYGPVTAIGRVLDARRILVGVRSSLYLLDWTIAGDSALRLVTQLDLGLPDNSISEGKADADGRFWVGTKGPQTGDDIAPDKGTLYSVEQERYTSPQIQLRPVTITKGLEWSLNNSVLYYVDSATQKIEAFDYDLQRGDIANRRTILDIIEAGFDNSVPAGLTIDSQGYLWVTLMYGGTVLHVDPDRREIITKYKVPASRLTNVVWGGPNYEELFVTSAKDVTEGTKPEPFAGSLFTIRDTGFKGVQRHAFKFDNADYY